MEFVFLNAKKLKFAQKEATKKAKNVVCPSGVAVASSAVEAERFILRHMHLTSGRDLHGVLIYSIIS